MPGPEAFHCARRRFSRRVVGRISRSQRDGRGRTLPCDPRGRPGRAVAEADAIMLFHDIPHLGEASFSRAGKCKCVVRAGVGYNNVDLAAAGRHGVIVCNVPDYGTEEVADHAILFLLALARRLVPCHQAIRSGRWHYENAVGTPRLRGKILGLIGCGRIGSATGLRAKALGMDVVFYDPYLPQGTGQGAGRPPRLSRSRSCWSRAISSACTATWTK